MVDGQERTKVGASWFRWIGRAILWGLALFYAYGALVHILNMAGLTGFDWSKAPLKWQSLDVAYLILDVLVVVTLVTGRVVGGVLLAMAALSQIVLYTVLRDWIIDVPDAFRPDSDQLAYLDLLVAFHMASLVALILAWWLGGFRPRG